MGLAIIFGRTVVNLPALPNHGHGRSRLVTRCKSSNNAQNDFHAEVPEFVHHAYKAALSSSSSAAAAAAVEGPSAQLQSPLKTAEPRRPSRQASSIVSRAQGTPSVHRQHAVHGPGMVPGRAQSPLPPPARKNPQQLTAELLASHSIRELHACMTQHRDEASGICIAASITHLAKLAQRSGGRAPHAGTQAAPDRTRPMQLVETTLDLAMELLRPKLRQLTTRGYANCIWACSKLATCVSPGLEPHGAPWRPAAKGQPNAGHITQATSTDQLRRRQGTDGVATDKVKGQKLHSSPGSLRERATASASELADAMLLHCKANSANAQDLANLCYGLASLGLGCHAAWEALLPRAAHVASSFESHSLSNVLWALGRTRYQLRNPALLPALLSQALRLMREEGGGEEEQGPRPPWPRPNSEVTGASSGQVDTESGESHKDSYGADAEAANSPEGVPRAVNASSMQQRKSQRLPHHQGPPSPQFLANITWALARLQHHDDAFMCGVERLFPLMAHAANVQNLSNVLWAFATLERPSAQLFGGVAPLVSRLASSGDIGPQSLSNITWAYAKIGMYDAQLFDTLSAACQESMHCFKAQDLANVAWAFGQVAHRDRALFAAIVRTAPRLLPRMHPGEVSQLAWAMATLNFTSDRVCSQLSDLVEAQLEAQPPHEVWAAGVAEGGGSMAADGDGREAEPWRMQALANVAWAYSVIQPGDTRLFAAVFAHADGLLAAPHQSHRPHAFEVEGDIRVVRQLYHAHMAHRLACLNGHAQPAGSAAAQMSPGTLRRCRSAWKQHVMWVKTSGTQLEVLEVLRGLGYSCQSEAVLAGGLFCVDISVSHNSGIEVLIEVDGPYHFSANDHKPLGEQLLRNRLIRALGYVLVCVPFFEWKELRRDEGLQRDYLQAKLEDAVHVATNRCLPDSSSGPAHIVQ